MTREHERFRRDIEEVMPVKRLEEKRDLILQIRAIWKPVMLVLAKRVLQPREVS
jgi:hypothetical protein